MEEGKDISNIIKSDKFLAGLLVIIVIAIFSFIGYVLINKTESPPAVVTPDLEKIRAEKIAEQLKELSKTPPQLSEKEVNIQLKTLSKNKPTLTEEEVKKQLESLNKN